MSKPIRSIFEEEFLVTSADSDFTHKLRVSSIVNMFIQIAWHHAEELGFGIKYLHQNNLAWVLSKLHLKINSLPHWNDPLKLITWPKGINRLYYLRDLEVFNKSGQLIACATSDWLLIDTKSKRPKLQGPDEAIFNLNKDKHAIEALTENLVPLAGYKNYYPLKAAYSDIDFNQHLTTTSYIDWMLNTFDMDYLLKYQCIELILNFIREIPYGIEVSVNRVSNFDKNIHDFEFIKHDGGQLLFLGRMLFNDAEKK
jgi:medium-chain acyl-[acyl-carrier-protein] hydrolase